MLNSIEKRLLYWTKQQILHLANIKLSEAPADGKQYVRKDGIWVEVVMGGTHRGVMIYNQVTEPTDQEDGDIWIVR